MNSMQLSSPFMKTQSSRNFRVSGQAQHGFKSEFCAGEDGQVSTERLTGGDMIKI